MVENNKSDDSADIIASLHAKLKAHEKTIETQMNNKKQRFSVRSSPRGKFFVADNIRHNYNFLCGTDPKEEVLFVLTLRGGDGRFFLGETVRKTGSNGETSRLHQVFQYQFECQGCP